MDVRAGWRCRPLTPEGTACASGSFRPGVVVGEVALYTGAPRTADVVAEAPAWSSVSREEIARLEADDPKVATALHRWLAETLAGRLSETEHTFDTLLD